MKQLKQKVMLAALLLGLFTLPAFAASASLSNSELERILAPIALFPDSLLGNILTAAALPDQVIAADAWIAEHENLPADKVMKECESQKWDPSVKALLLVPETLEQMCNNMTWTQQIGNAFVDQHDAVYTAIQNLRKKAKDLKDSKDVKVVTDKSGCISIGATDPDVIVVPRYSPTVVYTSSSSLTTAAIIWGCVFVADIVYNCCVWDWYNHHYWLGPGYNHCYYYGGIFYPWGPRCYVPPPLHHHGPPPPPYHPHHPPHYDPHHPPHYDGHSHQPPHHGPHHDPHHDPHHGPDNHDPHHGPDHNGLVPPQPQNVRHDPAHGPERVSPKPTGSVNGHNAVSSPKNDGRNHYESRPARQPEIKEHRSRQHHDHRGRNRLSSSNANLIPRQTIDSPSVSGQQSAFSGSRQHHGSNVLTPRNTYISPGGSPRSNLTRATGSSNTLGELSSSSSRSHRSSDAVRSYSSSSENRSERRFSGSSSSAGNYRSSSGRSFSGSSHSSGRSGSGFSGHSGRSSRHGRR